MSGVFGNVTPIAVPDFAATAARAQEFAARRQQMDQQNALTAFFRDNAQGFASDDPAKRMNLLAMLASQGGQGAAMALPMLGQERQRQELRAIMNDEPIGGARPAGMPQGGDSALPPGDMSLPRGIRNNNPLNLSYVQGQPGVQGTDGRFGRYGSMEDGVAASVRQLQMYGQRGVNTIEGIIGRWAPPSENNTPAYVAAVARATGLDPRAPIDMNDAGLMTRLVAAMARHENGRPVDPGVVFSGVQRALGGGQGRDTIPTQNAAPGAAPGAAAVPVADNDARIATLTRRAERLAAAGYQQEAQTTLALIQSMRRGESEPLERVRRPDGTEVLVPRSRAAGMESAPAPRETPGAFGAGDTGRARQYVEELAPAVRDGTASPEQLRRYGTAVAALQAVETRPDGTRVTNPLPPYAPGLDWVAQRYPGFVFDGAAQPGAAPAQGAQQGVPAAPAGMGDAAPAVPSLPPAGAVPTLPGAQGGVQRSDNAMEGATRRQIEEQIVGNQDAISRLTGLQQSFRPEFQTYGARWTNLWASLRERGGGRLSPQETERLRTYTQARAAALENLNNTIKETTGAAMSESEAARITATMPNPGTGLFDGDSPTEFQAKLDRAIEGTRRALIRRHYALSRGLNPTSTGIELSEIPGLVDRRGREIEAELRQGSPDADNAQVRQQVRARLRQEFGI